MFINPHHHQHKKLLLLWSSFSNESLRIPGQQKPSEFWRWSECCDAEGWVDDNDDDDDDETNGLLDVVEDECEEEKNGNSRRGINSERGGLRVPSPSSLF